MSQTSIKLKKIYEHDMDLLILEEFVADKRFAMLFLDKVGLGSNYTLEKAVHSLSDAKGESDITFVLQYPDKKVALLIEDKIDAQAMPEQSKRYHERATTAEQRGEYQSHFVMLAAPAEYLTEHASDPNSDYDFKIKYEELRNYFLAQHTPRAAFKAEIINFAISEKKTGYQVQEVESVTMFWNKLRCFCKENYPNLNMVGSEAPKGASAAWPEFRTAVKTVKVIYKSQRGIVDLEFPKYGNRTGDLRAIIASRADVPFSIEPTGQSACVRISNENWRLSFTQNFEACRSILSDVLDAVSFLCDLAAKLNYADLY